MITQKLGVSPSLSSQLHTQLHAISPEMVAPNGALAMFSILDVMSLELTSADRTTLNHLVAANYDSVVLPTGS